MSIDPRLLTALVRDARGIIEAWGMDVLLRDIPHGDGCGCMGPQGDDPLCPCAMTRALNQHLVIVLNEIDPQVALTVMRQRLVRALAG